MMRPVILYSILLSAVLSARAATPADELRDNTLLRHATISLLVQDMHSGETVAELNPRQSLTPASTLKLVTTATALELLRPDFRYETRVETDGQVDEAGVLHGNLYIRGAGDPTLGSLKVMGGRGFLTYWVDAVRRAGIRTVRGRVVADDGLFDLEGVNPQWSWEDIGNYYAPGIYALSYSDNTACVHFYSGPVGTKPEITRVVPELPDVTIHNHLRSSPVGLDSAWFYGAPRARDRFVYGEIPANRSDVIERMDIPNPGLLLARHFHRELTEAGIAVDSLPASGAHTAPAGRRCLYTHRSMPLGDIATVINVKSNNHYAEHVFRTLALQRDRVSTVKGSLEVIRDHWRRRGLPMEQLFMYDGSGLARANAVSAEFLVSLLTYMHTQSPAGEAFFRTLPVSGVSGTMGGVLRHTPLHGKVHAKSGSFARVRSYAGYISHGGRDYAFAIILNNFNGRDKAAVRAIEKFLLQLFAEDTAQDTDHR